MIQWENTVRERTINWLLEETNPSVRYFTLRDILDKREDDPQVLAAKHLIPESRIVKEIFGKQNQGGYWMEPANPYHPKYKSSYWTIMTLGQLGMDRTDQKVAKACEYIFQFQSVDGGFSSYTRDRALGEYEWLRKKGEKLPSVQEYAAAIVHEHEYSCLTGNMAKALIRIGYEKDPRVQKALEWLTKIQNTDGGWLCPYWRAHIKDKHGCFYGTICPLEAFSVASTESLRPKLKETVDKGAEFLLVHRLFKADHHRYRTIKQHWLTLSFPMFTTYNILRGLDVVTKLGYVKDERLTDAVEALLQKRKRDGTWILEHSPTGRMQANIEPKGESSKWITLVALRVLKRMSSGS